MVGRPSLATAARERYEYNETKALSDKLIAPRLEGKQQIEQPVRILLRS